MDVATRKLDPTQPEHRRELAHFYRVLATAFRDNGQYNSANKVEEYAHWCEHPKERPSWFAEEGYATEHVPPRDKTLKATK